MGGAISGGVAQFAVGTNIDAHPGGLCYRENDIVQNTPVVDGLKHCMDGTAMVRRKVIGVRNRVKCGLVCGDGSWYGVTLYIV